MIAGNKSNQAGKNDHHVSQRPGRRAALAEENEVKSVSIPVYEEDGKTAIGTFVVGSG